MSRIFFDEWASDPFWKNFEQKEWEKRICYDTPNTGVWEFLPSRATVIQAYKILGAVKKLYREEAEAGSMNAEIDSEKWCNLCNKWCHHEIRDGFCSSIPSRAAVAWQPVPN